MQARAARHATVRYELDPLTDLISVNSHSLLSTSFLPLIVEFTNGNSWAIDHSRFSSGLLSTSPPSAARQFNFSDVGLISYVSPKEHEMLVQKFLLNTFNWFKILKKAFFVEIFCSVRHLVFALKGRLFPPKMGRKCSKNPWQCGAQLSFSHRWAICLLPNAIVWVPPSTQQHWWILHE